MIVTLSSLTPDAFIDITNDAIRSINFINRNVAAIVISVQLFYKLANAGFAFYPDFKSPASFNGIPVLRTSDITDDSQVMLITE